MPYIDFELLQPRLCFLHNIVLSSNPQMQTLQSTFSQIQSFYWSHARPIHEPKQAIHFMQSLLQYKEAIWHRLYASYGAFAIRRGNIHRNHWFWIQTEYSLHAISEWLQCWILDTVKRPETTGLPQSVKRGNAVMYYVQKRCRALVFAPIPSFILDIHNQNLARFVTRYAPRLPPPPPPLHFPALPLCHTLYRLFALFR